MEKFLKRRFIIIINSTIISLCAIVIASILLTIIGYYLYDKDLSNVSDSTGHVGMGGIAFAYLITKFFSLNLIWTSVIMFIFVILFLNIGEYVHQKFKIKYSSILSFQTSLSAAIIALIFSYSKIGIDLHAFLFGNINLLSFNDLILLAISGLIFVIFYIFNYQKILLISISPIEANLRNINVNFINQIMISFIGIVIVLLISFLGSFLITSLIAIPVIAINIISTGYKDKYINVFIFILLSMVIGYFISLITNTSVSAQIVLTQIVFLILISFYKKLNKK